MSFNGDKFEWVRYTPALVQAPDFQYLGPDNSVICKKEDLKDLGVRMSSDLTFDIQVEKVVTTANQMVSWGLRTFVVEVDSSCWFF